MTHITSTQGASFSCSGTGVGIVLGGVGGVHGGGVVEWIRRKVGEWENVDRGKRRRRLVGSRVGRRG